MSGKLKPYALPDETAQDGGCLKEHPKAERKSGKW